MELSKIGIIGIGNMGSAILRGLLSKNHSPENLYINNKSSNKTDHFKKCGVNVIPISEMVEYCEAIIIAVKPYTVGDITAEISKVNSNNRPIIVSVAAGISVDFLEKNLGVFAENVAIAMPNTPALVSAAITGFIKGTTLSEEAFAAIIKVFEALGNVQKITEQEVHGFTAIAGCSPAYAYLFIEAMADAGVLHGLKRADAYAFAAQSLLGAAKMVLETNKHPAQLKDEVCSPGGVTIEAVAALEEGAFRATVINAMTAAVNKSKQMSR